MIVKAGQMPGYSKVTYKLGDDLNPTYECWVLPPEILFKESPCHCYPECRIDCPDHLQCVERLPMYAERVFGTNRSFWPYSILEKRKDS